MSHSSPDFLGRYGPWAIVAGASEGLGAEFATELAARGLNLVLIARRPPVLEELAEVIRNEYDVDVRALALDLGESNIASKLDEATSELEIGLLIYNAAYSLIGPFLDATIDEHSTELNVNCRAPLTLTHLFGRRMTDRGRGGIVLLSSMAGLQGSPLIANYAATKAYNLILAEGLWDELRESGVDVLACCAGATRTPNYERSRPATGGSSLVPVLEPGAVVRETLAALGKRPSFIPGRRNRLAAALLNRFLSRKRAIAIMGNNMRAMYPK